MRIVIDDFGAGHSNFDRVFRLEPNIIKLDRSLVVESLHNPTNRRMVKAVSTLIQEAGSLVLMEGIETEDEAILAIDSGVDLAQGYYFGRARAQLRQDGHAHPRLDRAWRRFVQEAENNAARRSQLFAVYRTAFAEAANRVAAGEDARDACAAFLQLPHVNHCYRLDSEGRQTGQSIRAAPDPDYPPDPRFSQLEGAMNARWYHRQYFKSAWQHHGTVQISRPYLSATDGRYGIILSITVASGGTSTVLCGDLHATRDMV